MPKFKPDRSDGVPRKEKVTVRFTESDMRILKEFALRQGVCIGEIVRQAIVVAAAQRLGPFDSKAQKGKVPSL